MVNLELYRVFYTVAKCGSLTKAAEELYISQPAVSQAIKQLEIQLGGKLFNRVSRGMELTDNGGKAIFEYVSQAVELLDKAENKFSEVHKIATGNLRISSPDTITSHILLDNISKFHNKYPNVVISFLNSTTHETIENVKNGKADIGFVNLPFEDNSVDFIGNIKELNDVFVVNSKFKKIIGDNISLNDISNYPLLMLEQNTSTRQEIIKFTSSINVDLTPEFELGSLELIVEMAKKGLGVACVPREFVKSELEKEELYELNVTPVLPTRGIGIIIKNVKEKTFVLDEFLKTFK